ncbi:hypothetical protein [Candidatus Methylocalor cossyra]|uniref:Rubrerythrin n=1 Tax=Candidatus Methylocalor cossyra TaxID=3108543 RepID=A0ABP1CBU2_9GAMM
MDNTLRNFEQVKDVLDYGIELHHQLRALYDNLSQHSDQKRVQLVLDYLSRHERNRAAALSRFEQASQRGSLEVWLQFAPTREIEQRLADCAIRPDMTVEDVIRTALAFDDALIAIYREAAREADDTHARALFENLAEMEEQEKRRFIRDVGWLEDV